jgi:hypothetical protein
VGRITKVTKGEMTEQQIPGETLQNGVKVIIVGGELMDRITSYTRSFIEAARGLEIETKKLKELYEFKATIGGRTRKEGRSREGIDPRK